jgi:hypothetical protein
VARTGEIRDGYSTFVGKLLGKRPLGRPRKNDADLREVFSEIRDGQTWFKIVNNSGLRYV